MTPPPKPDSSPRTLSDTELSTALEGLTSWTLDDGKLHRSFTFENFRTAFAFMTRIAIYADSHAHHPEWFNVYNRVDVWLTTHDAGGITEKDLHLAREMERA